jgi:hypothetical protein
MSNPAAVLERGGPREARAGWISALFYLQFHSIRNRLWMRVRRLKKPKYLVAAIVGGLYFYFYFFRWLYLGRGGAKTIGPASAGDMALTYEAVGAFALFVLVLLNWVIPKERAALIFSEAEVAFLFPAPISRQGLIHYKLLRSQLAILFTTFFLTLISGRGRGGSSTWFHIAGWWLILSTLNLHFLGASFARSMLLERGISNWQRRKAVLGLVLMAGIATLVWARHTIPIPRWEEMQGGGDILAWLSRVLDSGPVPYLLLPFRLLVRPYLASDARSFLMAAWPVLALIAFHYWWVIRSNVAFEEASVELSRKMADRVAAARAGRWQAGQKSKRPRRPPFELHPIGAAPMALLWKNLIAAGQFFTLRFWSLLLGILIFISIFLGTTAPDSGVLPALSSFCLMLTIMSLFAGPQMVRQDFRQDLPMADVLKLYPLRGWQVALGELLAPAAILTGVQWCLLTLTFGLSSSLVPRSAMTIWGRLALALGAALLLPMLNLICLIIPNLAVLLFPGWFQPGKEAPQGIEAIGQRLIFMLGQLLVLLLALVPAALTFVAVFFPMKFFARWEVAVPPASLASAIALAIEGGLGLMLLGRLFERLDLSSESV